MIDYKKKENYQDYSVFTLNFLKNLNILKEDAKICTYIDLIINKLAKKNIIEKIFLSLLGYFMCPGKILIESAIVILIFTILLIIQKDLNTSKDFFASLYSSLLFFIGNSPSEMTNIEKTLGIIENYIGLFLLNVFTISLAKKYLK